MTQPVVVAGMKCNICGCQLDQKDDRITLNCGGTCLRCMAQAGDPDCIKLMLSYILSRVAGPHNNLIYVGRDYTLAQA